MWLSRTEHDRLLATAAQHATCTTTHTRALRELARRMQAAEKRAGEAEMALQIERHDNSRTVRHLINSLLRAKEIGAYPVPAVADTPKKAGPLSEPAVYIPDEGEVEALMAASVQSGVGWSRNETIEFLKRERSGSA